MTNNRFSSLSLCVVGTEGEHQGAWCLNCRSQLPSFKLKQFLALRLQFVVPQAGAGCILANLQNLHEKILLQELREKTGALVRTIMAARAVSSAVNPEAGHDTEPV